MGKKKSKTAKQKQNALAKKLARSLEKKLGVSSERRRGQEAKATTVPHRKTRVTKTKRTAAAVTVEHVEAMDGVERIKETKASAVGATTNNTAPKQKGGDDEAASFAREHASVQERVQVMVWKRNHQTKRKSGRHHRRNGPPRTTPSVVGSWAPPTFASSDAQKTIPQLIRETTERVNHAALGSSGTERAVMTPTGTAMDSRSTSGSSPWDAANRNDNNGTPRRTWDRVHSNPWTVLDHGDADDETETAPVVPSLTFAPPSFSFGTAATTTTTLTTERVTEVDPDL